MSMLSDNEHALIKAIEKLLDCPELNADSTSELSAQVMRHVVNLVIWIKENQ